MSTDLNTVTMISWDAFLGALSWFLGILCSIGFILVLVFISFVIVFHILRLVHFIMDLIVLGIWIVISEYLTTASLELERNLLLYVLIGWAANGAHVFFQIMNIALTGYHYIPAFIASVCLFTANTLHLYVLYRKGFERRESEIRERILRNGLHGWNFGEPSFM